MIPMYYDFKNPKIFIFDLGLPKPTAIVELNKVNQREDSRGRPTKWYQRPNNELHKK